MPSIEFVKWRESDYWTAGVVVKPLGAMWIAWATHKGDPWRDDEREIKWFGVVKYIGEGSVGRGLVIRRFKIAAMLGRRAASV